MAETTGIEWTDPLIKPLASLKFSLVPNAIRFEMPPFMALMAEGYAVANLKPEAGEFRERLNMMRSQIAATAVSAVLASIVIALKNRLSPIAVFGASAGLAIPLSQTMLRPMWVGQAVTETLTAAGHGPWRNSVYVTEVGDSLFCLPGEVAAVRRDMVALMKPLPAEPEPPEWVRDGLTADERERIVAVTRGMAHVDIPF